jgi:hypothetical protein
VRPWRGGALDTAQKLFGRVQRSTDSKGEEDRN